MDRPPVARGDSLLAGFRSMLLWWSLQRTLESDTTLPSSEGGASLSRKKLVTLVRARRTKLEAVDISAATTAKRDFLASRIIVAAKGWVISRLHKTVGYVGDLIGAAMSYGPKWSRVPRAEFGLAMRRVHFFMPPDSVPLNGCSNPALARPVAVARREWAKRIQLDPVQWRFKALHLRLSQTLEKVCKKIGSTPSDTSFVFSKVEGMSTVLRSIPWVGGDTLLIIHHSSFATSVYPTAALLSEEYGLEVVVLYMDLLPSSHILADRVSRVLDTRRPRVIVAPHLLDDAQLLPVSQLVFQAAQLGCATVIDGSEVLGCLTVDVGGLNADYYVAQLDNYCYCMPGMAVVVSNGAPRTHLLQSLTVSYFFGGGYSDEWRYTGHIDHSTWLCATQAFQFQKFICPSLREHCIALCREAVCYLCDVWNVTPLRTSQSGEAVPVAVVPLPTMLCSGDDTIGVVKASLRQWNIDVGLVRVIRGDGMGVFCVRAVCQVYNCERDIKRLAAAVCALVEMKKLADHL